MRRTKGPLRYVSGMIGVDMVVMSIEYELAVLERSCVPSRECSCAFFVEPERGSMMYEMPTAVSKTYRCHVFCRIKKIMCLVMSGRGVV